MDSPSLSIIIPSFKDKYLNKTIESLLLNARGSIEIIPVLDGYPQDVLQDERVHPILLGEKRGMRNAINTGIRMARGEYIGKCDSHCTFGESFDTILTTVEEGIVVPRRYFLDVDKWEVMDIPPVDYEKLVIDKERNKFSGVRWTSRTEERKDIPVDETMAFQGSFWVMKKSWWNTLGELQEEGYGRFTQEPTELMFKTWKAGGKIYVNKNTWYAHKHRDFSRTHQVSREESDTGFEYALNAWRDYYESEVKPRWT
jgi:glycosyltransferase involved in cell wall biosynthesis